MLIWEAVAIYVSARDAKAASDREAWAEAHRQSAQALAQAKAARGQ